MTWRLHQVTLPSTIQSVAGLKGYKSDQPLRGFPVGVASLVLGTLTVHATADARIVALVVKSLKQFPQLYLTRTPEIDVLVAVSSASTTKENDNSPYSAVYRPEMATFLVQVEPDVQTGYPSDQLVRVSPLEDLGTPTTQVTAAGAVSVPVGVV